MNLTKKLNKKQIAKIAEINTAIRAKSVLVKVTGKDGLTYTVDPTVTYKGRNKFAIID